MDRRPLVAPVFPAGAEPLPPGWTEEDRIAMTQQKRMENYMGMAMESCVVKSAMSGALGTSSLSSYPSKRLVIHPHISLYQVSAWAPFFPSCQRLLPTRIHCPEHGRQLP